MIGKLVGSGHTVVQKTDRKIMWPANKLGLLLKMFPQVESPIRDPWPRLGNQAVHLILLDWDEVPEHLR